MSSDTHKKTLKAKNKNDINKLLKSGGRKGALSDFNRILKKAAKGTK